MFNIAPAAVTGVRRAPSLAIGRVVLTVRDLGLVADFYQHSVGLHRLQADGEAILLSAGETPLIELRHDPAATPHARSEAGLFHTALLVPDRAALGTWLKHSVSARIPLLGASDHLVSEALYLVDPEGNGIEIYADRPPSEWHWHDGQVDMPSKELDLASILKQADHGDWKGIAAGTRIGHVHLQVGAIAPAEQFYAGTLGLGITCRYPGGTFFAAPSYHHHIATNIWNSRGAGLRTPHMTGLAEVEMHVDPRWIEAIRGRAPSARTEAGRLLLEDPWGTAITLVPTNDTATGDAVLLQAH